MFLLKIVLILLGILMLVGGGICVASNAVFTFSSLRNNGEISIYLTLMGISAVISLIGWWLTGVSRKINTTATAAAQQQTRRDD